MPRSNEGGNRLESCDMNIHRRACRSYAGVSLLPAPAVDDALPSEAEVHGGVEAPPVLFLQVVHVA